MREEIKVAASWWTKEIKKKYNGQSGSDAMEKFQTSLVEGLTKRCTGHWNVDNPLKGCAYRSVSYDCRVDPLLRKAIEDAGIKQSVEELLVGSRYIMFINPGAVKLRNVAFCSATPEIIYQEKKSPTEYEDSHKRQSAPVPRGNPLSSFVQKGLSSMGNTNYGHLNRYLKQQQMLVPPTM
mmetsp:Transcript_3999/g.9433  ORF Transcript_3999/g.9433 Transcript_3999/m.9433 type:complete len:180 (-) Transcript_3999:230-769(-)